MRGLPPTAADQVTHLEKERSERWIAFDEFFELNTTQGEIWEQRAKTMIQYLFQISTNDPQWWNKLAEHLVTRRIPGFSIRQPNKKKRGQPKKWDFEKFAELYADIEYLKMNRKLANIAALVLANQCYRGAMFVFETRINCILAERTQFYADTALC